MKNIEQVLREIEERKPINDIDTGVLESINDARNEALKYTSRFAAQFLHYFVDELIAEYPEILDYCDISVDNSDMKIQDGMYLSEESLVGQVLEFDVGYLC